MKEIEEGLQQIGDFKIKKYKYKDGEFKKTDFKNDFINLQMRYQKGKLLSANLNMLLQSSVERDQFTKDQIKSLIKTFCHDIIEIFE